MNKMGKGIAFSSVTLTAPGVFASPFSTETGKVQKPVRIGIIGAENSHTVDYGKLFNVEKKFPGVEVLYVWGETEEFARNAMEKGSIPNMVKDPVEMMGKIDALIVDHRHPKYHLKAATPFVKAGIPTFIDKPFCYRVEEGKSFLSMAHELGTPVSSYSSIAHSNATIDMKDQVASLGNINQVIRFGPVDLDSIYGGVFFYGVHIIQPLMYMFGDDVEKVKVSREGINANATVVFGDGLFATLIFRKFTRGWETYVETDDGLTELKSRVEEGDPPKHYVDMVEMFRTGREPRSHESILKCVAVLEALERSASSQDWENVKI